MKPKIMKCIVCGEGNVVAKGLCRYHYTENLWERKRKSLPVKTGFDENKGEQLYDVSTAEFEFIKNFFKHSAWVFHPCRFRFQELTYEPDFYDAERNVFIEVVGTRQAYEQNKKKYKLFKEFFPPIVLEFRNREGDLCRHEEGGKIRNVPENKKK